MLTPGEIFASFEQVMPCTSPQGTTANGRKAALELHSESDRFGSRLLQLPKTNDRAGPRHVLPQTAIVPYLEM
jgi:hypothetical protein